jgi:hypothetical protein
MNNFNFEETKKNLVDWIEGLKESARNDEAFSISWFKGTKNYPFAIIGGWTEGFNEEWADIMCISKGDPSYCMCVKIAINEGPYAYTDFELMNMPYDEAGNVDDTCVALEWDDDPESLADWLLCEWERIMTEHGEVVD